MTYAITAKGATVLEELGRLPAGAMKRARDNQAAGREYLGHTLWEADLSLALDEAAPRHGVTLHHDRELARTIPRDFKKYPGAPWSMQTNVIIETPVDSNKGRQAKRTTHTVGVTCDKAFVIDDPQRRRRANFMAELDRGTMPVARWKRDGSLWLQGTSVIKKCLAYDAAYQARLEKELFGWSSFRVLIITTTQARVATMQAEIAKLFGGKGSELFWLASREAIDSRRQTKGEQALDILEHPFVDCHGKPHRLLD